MLRTNPSNITFLQTTFIFRYDNFINVVRFIIINSVKALQKSKWLFLFTSFVGGVGLLLMLIGWFGGLECDGGRSVICTTCCLKERKRHQY